MACFLYPAEEAGEAQDWDLRWAELESQDNIAAADRYNRQIDLLKEAGQTVGWGDPEVWDLTTRTLDALEQSPEIEAARRAYISLLGAIGAGMTGKLEPLPGEPVLREYFQRALGLARDPGEEGRTLFYLAESLWRSAPQAPDTRRRMEAFLQQALLSLPQGPPKDAVHSRLAILYSKQADKFEATAPGEQSYLARAVFHYRAILDMPEARENIREAARAELDLLLQPGLELDLKNRFLPQSDIQVDVLTRNLQEVEIAVYSLPWTNGLVPLNHKEMTACFNEVTSSIESLWIRKSFKISPRDRFDWQRNQLRLGVELPGGWYWLQVTADGFSREELLLVTPLELTALPDDSGSLTLWAVDAETGTPVANAQFSIFDESGNLLASPVADSSGLAEVEPDATLSWAEIHVTDGIHPGVILRADRTAHGAPAPWLIPASIEVRPGNDLVWAMADIGPTDLEDYIAQLRVVLPEGQSLQVQPVIASPDYLQLKVTLPPDVSGEGPIYLELPGGAFLLLSHLRQAEMLPFQIAFTGERIEAGQKIFLSSVPVGVQIQQGLGRQDSGSEFIRLRVIALDRSIIEPESPGLATAQQEPLLERILRIGTNQGDSAYLELPEFTSDGDALPLLVEVLRLESEEILGRAVLAMVPYRFEINLRVNQHIVQEGDSVEIGISPGGEKDLSDRSLSGHLVVYRETWESRYIHRKKGTLLTESEYLALPDRSLLGSAKTDFRLQERGFVREAVERIPIASSLEQTISVSLERSGYYQIELEGRDQDFRTNYPDGRLEVWVMPESGDLRAFRSESPRLIHERDAGGTEEILVLLDSNTSAVFLDLEFVDGSHTTEVFGSGSSALYKRIGLEGSPSLSGCHAIVAGDLKTALFSQQFPVEDPLQWQLDADRTSGLNPGAAISWSLKLVQGEMNSPLLWAFYRDSTDQILGGWLRAQQDARQRQFQQREQLLLSLSQSMPLYDPLNPDSPDPLPPENSAFTDFDSSALLALYPELMNLGQPTLDGNTTLLLEPSAEGMNWQLNTELPSRTGRWQLAVFNPFKKDRIDWQTWRISTELPIRTAMEGPLFLRLNDIAGVSLSIENTTRRQETLEVVTEAIGAVQVSGRERDVRVLEPGQKALYPIEATAVSGGDGLLKTRVQGAFSSSEASFTCRVLDAPTHPEIKATLVMPGSGQWQQSIPLQNWISGRLLISSGLGATLTEIWPLLREREVVAEPLLAALGDWALDHVQSRHGILLVGDGLDDDGLLQQLERHASGGGWTWTPGKAPDPWLSALVLWSLESFSSMSENVFPSMRREARDYLESVLFDENVDQEARLLALRALAVPAFNDPRIRPSRIQAKSFLEFLHQRNELSNSHLAGILQVARAFHFNEEVRLLLDMLKDRLATTSSVAGGSFWSNSLIFLALAEGSEQGKLREAILNKEFQHLTRTGPARSWEQFGGFMNLLAAFLWEGDFNLEGVVSLSVDDNEPISISLDPNSPNKGKYLAAIDQAFLDKGEIQLNLDVGSSNSPVSVVLLGQRDTPYPVPPYPEQSIRYYHEHVEPTLLSGTRLRIDELTDDTELKPGDSLQAHVFIYVQEPEDIAEFEFIIPAGASLPMDAIQYSFEAAMDESNIPLPAIAHRGSPDSVKQVLRMEPFSAGRHEFILSYRIDWPGSYALPASRLLLPRTGRVFSLGSPLRLEITPSQR